LTTILVVILASISVIGIMADFPTFGGRLTRINAMGNSMVDAWRPGHGLLWLWLGLLISTLATLCLSLALLRRRATIEVQMDDGRVVILETAIRKYIRTALAGVPGITGQKIELRPTRHGLNVSIYVHVRTHDRLPEIEKSVIARVRTALTQELGITSLGEVNVFVKDFELSKKAPSERKAPDAAKVTSSPEEEPEEGTDEQTDRDFAALEVDAESGMARIQMPEKTAETAEETSQAQPLEGIKSPPEAEEEPAEAPEAETTSQPKRMRFFGRWKRDSASEPASTEETQQDTAMPSDGSAADDEGSSVQDTSDGLEPPASKDEKA
jgi:uncharacterized alkaline shock family protein YloU